MLCVWNWSADNEVTCLIAYIKYHITAFCIPPIVYFPCESNMVIMFLIKQKLSAL